MAPVKPTVVTAFAEGSDAGGEGSAPSSPSRGGRGLRGKGEATSFPAKMYVIQREGQRQYSQLDRKVQ